MLGHQGFPYWLKFNLPGQSQIWHNLFTMATNAEQIIFLCWNIGIDSKVQNESPQIINTYVHMLNGLSANYITWLEVGVGW